jgi:hypothetical protein
VSASPFKIDFDRLRDLRKLVVTVIGGEANPVELTQCEWCRPRIDRLTRDGDDPLSAMLRMTKFRKTVVRRK